MHNALRKNDVILHQAETRCATILKVESRPKENVRGVSSWEQTSQRKAGGNSQSETEEQQISRLHNKTEGNL